MATGLHRDPVHAVLLGGYSVSDEHAEHSMTVIEVMADIMGAMADQIRVKEDRVARGHRQAALPAGSIAIGGRAG